jgi:hypothetical protein
LRRPFLIAHGHRRPSAADRRRRRPRTPIVATGMERSRAHQAGCGRSAADHRRCVRSQRGSRHDDLRSRRLGRHWQRVAQQPRRLSFLHRSPCRQDRDDICRHRCSPHITKKGHLIGAPFSFVRSAARSSQKKDDRDGDTEATADRRRLRVTYFVLRAAGFFAGAFLAAVFFGAAFLAAVLRVVVLANGVLLSMLSHESARENILVRLRVNFALIATRVARSCWFRRTTLHDDDVRWAVSLIMISNHPRP